MQGKAWKLCRACYPDLNEKQYRQMWTKRARIIRGELYCPFQGEAIPPHNCPRMLEFMVMDEKSYIPGDEFKGTNDGS